MEGQCVESNVCYLHGQCYGHNFHTTCAGANVTWNVIWPICICESGSDKPQTRHLHTFRWHWAPWAGSDPERINAIFWKWLIWPFCEILTASLPGADCRCSILCKKKEKKIGLTLPTGMGCAVCDCHIYNSRRQFDGTWLHLQLYYKWWLNKSCSVLHYFLFWNNCKTA